MRETVLLTGAELADGTGEPLRAAEVLVEGGRISAVEPPGTLPRQHPTRDLSGLVLAPGFIDVHSHADNAPLLPQDDTTKIRQGVTTEIVGNCGFSLAPRSIEHAQTLSTFLQRLFPPIEFTWSGFHDLFQVTDQAGYVTNYCPLVGHGTLRIAAMGMAEHAPDEPAARAMESALEEGMAAGAFGLSSGLIYPPAVCATTAELVRLAEVLGGDGLYATHLRDEGPHLLDSIHEALRIGARAGRTQLSHIKATQPQNWGKLSPALETIRAARQNGQHVTHDAYPYTASSTMLLTVLPREFRTGDTETLLTRLSSTRARAELADALGNRDWNNILIATTISHEGEGQTIAEIAASNNTAPVDALIDILVRERLRVAMVNFSMHEHDLQLALADEHTMIGSDGLPPGTGGRPHPRLYGTFPRFLGRYVRERSLLDLPEAIRRMTALAAQEFRIPERGLVAPTYVADLVAFDANTVTDVGDYRDPVHPPAGISWVCQAGRTVVDNGAYLGGRHGSRLFPSS